MRVMRLFEGGHLDTRPPGATRHRRFQKLPKKTVTLSSGRGPRIEGSPALHMKMSHDRSKPPGPQRSFAQA